VSARGAALAAVLLLAVPADGQDATPLLEASLPDAADGAGETELERYLDQRDRLVVERLQRQPPLALGGGVALEVEAVIAFEPARLQERMLGIRVRLTGTDLSGEAALTHLDLREVEELVRAIDLMDELIATQSEESDAEVRHVSRDGLGIVATRTAGVSRFAIRLYGEPDTDPHEVAVPHETLVALKGHLERSRSYLFQQ
jgi:hypothetical protein